MTEKMAKTGQKKVKVAGDSPAHLVQIALTAEANRLVPLDEGRFVRELEEFDTCWPKNGWRVVLDALTDAGLVAS